MTNSSARVILPFLKKFLQARWIFLSLLLGAVSLNTFHLLAMVELTRLKRQHHPFVFYGFLFSGLDQFFARTPYVGYFTDKSFDDKAAAAQFAQAQYMLVPTVLDLNYQRHEWILMDCTSTETAMAKIKELGAVPVKKNKFGIILARQPRWKSR